MRNKVAYLAAAAAAGFGLWSSTTWGHHSFAAEFDINRPIELRGTIVEVEFINPHSWIHIEVENEDGVLERWAIEGGTPNTLFRAGVNRETLPLGAEVTVDGYQARDGSNTASGRDIRFPDGRTLFLSGSAPPRDESQRQ